MYLFLAFLPSTIYFSTILNMSLKKGSRTISSQYQKNLRQAIYHHRERKDIFPKENINSELKICNKSIPV